MRQSVFLSVVYCDKLFIKFQSINNGSTGVIETCSDTLRHTAAHCDPVRPTYDTSILSLSLIIHDNDNITNVKLLTSLRTL